MEIILLDKIDNLGNVGDIVTVKPGYARNYLFPKGLAVRSSKRNIAFVEEKRKNIEFYTYPNITIFGQIKYIMLCTSYNIIQVPRI